jgi:threonine dehydrogenase-like Zn-dependent dehydrogenase
LRAVTVDGPGHVSIVEIPRPKAIEAGDAVVRVTTSSIGPAELEQFARPGPGLDRVTPGGACAGIVEETGSAVSRLRVGDAVVVPASLSVPARPLPAHDSTRSTRVTTVVGRDLPGSLAGWLRVPAADYNLVALPRPAELDAPVAAAAGAVAVGLKAARRIAAARPRSLCLVGCGPSSLAFLLAWKALSGRSEVQAAVIATDPSPFRRAVARRLGAGAVGLPGESSSTAELAAEVKAKANVVAFDVVVVGPRTENGDLDPELAASLAGANSATVPLDQAGYSTTADVTDAIRMLDDGSLDVLPLVSHTFPLAEAQAAFDAAAGHSRGVLMVLLKP